MLFEHCDSPQPYRTIPLLPDRHRSFHFWHCHVRGIGAGQVYAFRIDGPRDLSALGSRFDQRKVLIDPYARANVNSRWERTTAIGPGDNVEHCMRSLVVDLDDYDWEGDTPLHTPMAETVVYEMHVRGLTASPPRRASGPAPSPPSSTRSRTCANSASPAVELLPVFDFDETQVLRTGPDGTPLRNYWGYDPYGFFAPHTGYCSKPPSRHAHHRVPRHGEGVPQGGYRGHPRRGLPTTPARATSSGRRSASGARPTRRTTTCGRRTARTTWTSRAAATLSTPTIRWSPSSSWSAWSTGSPSTTSTASASTSPPNCPAAPRLRDGGAAGPVGDRAVAGAVRDEDHRGAVGRRRPAPGRPVPGEALGAVERPVPRRRTAVRVRGDAGMVGEVASRLGGSADLFAAQGELPTNSINFITCHDGFTLNDLVSCNIEAQPRQR
ncbi:hypothetical protein ACRAWF_02105 [Streptomyces sp. L7]